MIAHPCGDDCWHAAVGYYWCRPCGEHHRAGECAVDTEGRALNPDTGLPWSEDCDHPDYGVTARSDAWVYTCVVCGLELDEDDDVLYSPAYGTEARTGPTIITAVLSPTGIAALGDVAKVSFGMWIL